MAARLIWSDRALDDLAEIITYIEKDSPAYARNVARQVFARAEALPDQPDLIRIVAVIHGARLVENARPL